MKRKIWPILYGIILTAFTLYVALDTFVIKRVYDDDAGELNLSMFESETESDETEENETEEETDPYTITITNYREYDTDIYVADITLASTQYFRTAFANDTYGKNVKAYTSQIAADHDAILAINGDFYGARDEGIVIRNGVIYRTDQSDDDVLCIYTDGTMKFVGGKEKTAEELLEEGVWQAFSFGPGLIACGEVAVSTSDEVSAHMASNPRTAIGMISANHFVFVVSDGRTTKSAGLSLYEMAEFLQSLGCTEAYNMDGGGSSTLYYNGEVLNQPTADGDTIKERRVSDIVYIAE